MPSKSIVISCEFLEKCKIWKNIHHHFSFPFEFFHPNELIWTSNCNLFLLKCFFNCPIISWIIINCWVRAPFPPERHYLLYQSPLWNCKYVLYGLIDGPCGPYVFSSKWWLSAAFFASGAKLDTITKRWNKDASFRWIQLLCSVVNIRRTKWRKF